MRLAAVAAGSSNGGFGGVPGPDGLERAGPGFELVEEGDASGGLLAGLEGRQPICSANYGAPRTVLAVAVRNTGQDRRVRKAPSAFIRYEDESVREVPFAQLRLADFAGPAPWGLYPDHLPEVVHRRHVQHQSLAQIAAGTGISVTTIRITLTRHHWA
ncbi:hypothetical protein ABT063_50595 [Streptomyces sp. NPDC002838]|uniref:hypothetical protein n=1 Tax=Streptomyces sp. NPDC002838 TaxID=3154436 RepID=UPI00331B2297